MPQVGRFKQLKRVVSRFRVLEVRDRGVGSVDWFGGFCWLSVIFGVRWLVETSAASLPSSARGILSAHASGFSVPLRIRTPVV